MKTVNYKGFQAAVEFEDGALFVKVLHIDDLLIAEFDKASDAQKVFEQLIDEYLADCADEGREADKPFKGSFNVRVSPALHRSAARQAADEGASLNSWVCTAIEEKLHCNKVSDRIADVFSKQRELVNKLAGSRFFDTGPLEFDKDPSELPQTTAVVFDARRKIAWSEGKGSHEIVSFGLAELFAAGKGISGRKLHG